MGCVRGGLCVLPFVVGCGLWGLCVVCGCRGCAVVCVFRSSS